MRAAPRQAVLARGAWRSMSKHSRLRVCVYVCITSLLSLPFISVGCHAGRRSVQRARTQSSNRSACRFDSHAQKPSTSKLTGERAALPTWNRKDRVRRSVVAHRTNEQHSREGTDGVRLVLAGDARIDVPMPALYRLLPFHAFSLPLPFRRHSVRRSSGAADDCRLLLR